MKYAQRKTYNIRGNWNSHACMKDEQRWSYWRCPFEGNLYQICVTKAVTPCSSPAWPERQRKICPKISHCNEIVFRLQELEVNRPTDLLLVIMTVNLRNFRPSRWMRSPASASSLGARLSFQLGLSTFLKVTANQICATFIRARNNTRVIVRSDI